MAVLSLDTFKNMLSVDITDTDNDTYLTFILESAEKLVENELGILLEPQDKTIEIFGNDSSFLSVPDRPVNSIIKVLEESAYSDIISSYDITSSIEINDSLLGVLYRKAITSISLSTKFCKYNKYVITYNVGFTTIPSDLQYAIYQIAVKMEAITENQKQGISKISTPDGTITYDSIIIPDSIQGILNKYRRYL